MPNLNFNKMYIIIKKDKAEHMSEKLHKMKSFICDVIEEIEEARERGYSDEHYLPEHSRHDGRHSERERFDDYDYPEREMARGRGGRRGGRY